MNELQKVKIINIKDEKFTFDISKVSVADFIAIETEKQRLSNSRYHQIATTFFANALNAANLIDMIATFRILNSNIEKGLNRVSFEELNILDVRDLLGVYTKELAPWFQAWMKEFNSPFEEEKDEEGE